MKEDPDIEILKAKKMKEMMKNIARQEKIKRELELKNEKSKVTDREIFRSYLYDRGEEVLTIAENQFPFETKMIVKKLTELIRNGEINNKISGGELLTLFRTVGLNIRMNTSIKIEEHGKYVSFGEKLKQYKEDYEKDGK
ncbi:MAG: DNA-binding protein [Nitrososphaeraceae archaeon]